MRASASSSAEAEVGGRLLAGVGEERFGGGVVAGFGEELGVEPGKAELFGVSGMEGADEGEGFGPVALAVVDGGELRGEDGIGRVGGEGRGEELFGLGGLAGVEQELGQGGAGNGVVGGGGEEAAVGDFGGGGVAGALGELGGEEAVFWTCRGLRGEFEGGEEFVGRGGGLGRGVEVGEGAVGARAQGGGRRR